MAFYDNYCRLCKKHGLKPQGEKARELFKVTRSTIIGWQKGVFPKVDALERLANYFGVTMEELLRDPENPTKSTVNPDLELINNNPDLTEYLHYLSTRPEMRMLFHTTKNATKADIEAAVEIIEGVRRAYSASDSEPKARPWHVNGINYARILGPEKAACLNQLKPLHQKAFEVMINYPTIEEQAEQLGVTYGTMRTYRSSIYNALGVHSEDEFYNLLQISRAPLLTPGEQAVFDLFNQGVPYKKMAKILNIHSDALRDRATRMCQKKGFDFDEFKKSNTPPLSSRLTDREIQVFDLLVEGFSTTKISKQLHLQLPSVDRLVKNIQLKFGFENREGLYDLAAWAADNPAADIESQLPIRTPGQVWTPLSDVEQAILDLLRQAKKPKEIAAELGLSHSNVSVYSQNIASKHGLKDVGELIAFLAEEPDTQISFDELESDPE